MSVFSTEADDEEAIVRVEVVLVMVVEVEGEEEGQEDWRKAISDSSGVEDCAGTVEPSSLFC